MQFQGKVALVTGAGSGIGRASAELLARQGARVGLLDRSEDEFQDVMEWTHRQGLEALPLDADVSDPGAIQNAIHKNKEYIEIGRIG